MKFLLIGNPNTGKTTLFNALTNSNQKVGNWHGVTNTYKVATMNGHSVVDLPGTYSLTPLTFEEKVAVDFLFADNHKSLCVNACELDSLEKNLFLTLQLLEYGQPTVVVVNNKNNSKYSKLNAKQLSVCLGVPVFLIDFENKTQVKKLKNFLQTHKPTLPNFEPVYLKQILNVINFESPNKKFSNSFFATKCFEQDEFFLKQTNKPFENKLEQICLLRHQHIKSFNCYQKQPQTKNKLDNILLGKHTAIPIFFAIMGIVFYLTFFGIGKILSDLLEMLMTDYVAKGFSHMLQSITQNAFLLGFFEQGVFGAFAFLIKFLPQIVLLFLFMHLIEQSGYLSRVAFVLDDFLGKFGLSGKSIYTILMGFGCTTTALMTARTVPTKSAKIKTALLTPYMSCSAKIPVYAVLGGVLFGAKNLLVVLFLYLLGLCVGFLLCLFFEKTFLKTKHTFAVLEFAPLTFDKPKNTIKNVWQSTKEFFGRIFVLVVCTNIVVWFLVSFDFSLAFVEHGKGSILQHISSAIAPIFSPLGFNSYALVAALICGLIAKEVVVSTLGLFALGQGMSLTAALATANSVLFLTPEAGFAFLVFVLLYPACFAAMGVLQQEVGSLWAWVSIATQLLLAYVLAFVAKQLFFVASVALVELLLLVLALVVFGVLLKKALINKCVKCAPKRKNAYFAPVSKK